jgi:hypothetical protein
MIQIPASQLVLGLLVLYTALTIYLWMARCFNPKRRKRHSKTVNQSRHPKRNITMTTRKPIEREISFDVDECGLIPTSTNPSPLPIPSKEIATVPTKLGDDFLTKVNGNASVGQQPEGEYRTYPNVAE